MVAYLLVTQLSDPKYKLKGEFDFVGKDASEFHIHLENQIILLSLVMPTSRKDALGTLFYLASIDVLSEREMELLKIARDSGWHIVATTVDFTFSNPQRLFADERGAKQLAARIDFHLAERAYAVEAMIDFLEKNRPELLPGPRVLVGMSAGAIAVPTVAARIGSLDAAVLIAGGENVAEILLQSPMFREHTILQKRTSFKGTNDAGNKEFNAQIVTDVKERSAFAQRAFEKSKLDPSRTAASLSKTPVLMVHARYDKIVPAYTGDALYASLGKPERWSYRTGHLGLCVMLRWKIKPILEWLEHQTAGHKTRLAADAACWRVDKPPF